MPAGLAPSSDKPAAVVWYSLRVYSLHLMRLLVRNLRLTRWNPPLPPHHDHLPLPPPPLPPVLPDPAHVLPLPFLSSLDPDPDFQFQHPSPQSLSPNLLLRPLLLSFVPCRHVMALPAPSLPWFGLFSPGKERRRRRCLQGFGRVGTHDRSLTGMPDGVEVLVRLWLWRFVLDSYDGMRLEREEPQEGEREGGKRRHGEEADCFS